MLAKRLVVALYDVACVALVAAILSLGFAQSAYAYIDPSVMTYTIQAVAGVAVALSTVAGVAFRRGRKTILNMLDIDENAKREFEQDISRTGTADAKPTSHGAHAIESPESASEDTPDEALSEQIVSEGAHAAAQVPTEAVEDGAESAKDDEKSDGNSEKPKKNRRKYAPKWRERFVYALVASAFTLFTVFIVAPFEVVGGSSGSLVFTLADVWWVPLPPVIGATVALALLLSALRGRVYNIALVLVAGLGLCAYVQALCLNIGLPIADGGTIIWADHMTMQIVSSIVWLALLVACVVLSLLNAKRAQGIVGIVGTFLLAIQAIGVLSLFIAPPVPSDSSAGGMDALTTELLSKTEIAMTEDQLDTVNPNHNVIVFVLDTFDTAYLTRDLGMNPDLLSGLTGFTNYENCTGTMIPTRFAIPPYLTGEMPKYGEPFSVYKAQRYARSTFLDDIYNANYSIGLYSDSLTIGALSEAEQYGITSKTVNMHKMPVDTMSYNGVLEALFYMGMYRDVPWPLKWRFWYYTDEINSMIVVYDPEADPDETVYVMDDIRYYNRLCKIRLSLEEDGYDGAFRFIHLLGAHYPFSYDEEVNDLGTDNSNVFKQSQGAIHIVT
ncbi:MAG: hypothetical protein IJH04_09260, partial [Eggerthellaceae bacterium]|nr:hypothetical protein [Eggerthellaceae bacterium]